MRTRSKSLTDFSSKSSIFDTPYNTTTDQEACTIEFKAAKYENHILETIKEFQEGIGYVVQVIHPLYNELMEVVFAFLSIREVANVQVVCKHWFGLTCKEKFWQRQCFLMQFPPKPDKITWLRWFIEMRSYGTYDPTILRQEIDYITLNNRKNMGALKIDSYPDVSIAFIGKPLSNGKIYAEFITRYKGTEIYIGATHKPEKVVLAKGMDIVQHEDTWAYTDGRRFGIQIQGNVYPAEHYGVGDVVGIFLNIDDKEVSFYKNQALQQKPFPLIDNESWQLFVMLDHAGDIVEITKFEFR